MHFRNFLYRDINKQWELGMKWEVLFGFVLLMDLQPGSEVFCPELCLVPSLDLH